MGFFAAAVSLATGGSVSGILFKIQILLQMWVYDYDLAISQAQ